MVVRMLVSLAVASLSVPAFAGQDPAFHHYRVTVTNVTAANVLSPALVVVQGRGQSLFQPGTAASPGLAALAETGATAALEAELADRGALGTAKADGPIFAGASKPVEVTVSDEALRGGATLAVAAMIGKSNDSFIALQGLPLARVYKLDAKNYDAGSEENTGNTGDFGSGGHPTAAAEGRISRDRGLNPRGDAPETLGWGPVAAQVTVERLD